MDTHQYFTRNARWIAILLLLGWYGFFLVQKVDLTTSDLGRHITNGSVEYSALTTGDMTLFHDVLGTNFYSYTDPGFTTVNHHWGTGLIFYAVHQLGGFGALSILFILISLATFLIFFLIAAREGGYGIAVPVAALVIPLIAERVEVRPEGFSYLFAAIFLWVLWNYHRHRIRARWLFALPLLQVLWVNMHIYFFLGPMLAGIVAVGALFFCRQERVKIRNLMFVFVGTSLATLINPFGYRAITYAFTIFNNYGYRLVENQTLWFLWNYGFGDPNIVLYAGVALLMLLAISGAWYRRRAWDFDSSAELAFFAFLGIGFGVAGFLALRNITLFGLFALPVLSFALHRALPEKYLHDPELVFLIGTTAAACGLFFLYHAYPVKLQAVRQNFGIGLQPNVEYSMDFLKAHHIAGPIFNNYDIGGFLIYENAPEKVFVDNRPEAYPASFFADTYIPMQENDALWQKELAAHDFNAIVFGYHDLTPWSQQFLSARLHDADWAPVYIDGYIIIFVRRTPQNADLIRQYEIPRSFFGITQ
ncbi:MAG: hypothetical protein KGI60_00295 [Patescibacteria group bacterium]|nr:hypothetical protein [Patescibacteria group bacterium]